MKIAIARTGYVGLSKAILLVQHSELAALMIKDVIDLAKDSRTELVGFAYFLDPHCKASVLGR